MKYYTLAKLFQMNLNLTKIDNFIRNGTLSYSNKSGQTGFVGNLDFLLPKTKEVEIDDSAEYTY